MTRGMQKQPRSGALVPDAKFIREKVSIVHVAEALGLKGDGRRYDCPRIWQRSLTQHNRARTLSMHLPSNTCRCFACDPEKGLSPVDLVIQIRNCTEGEAFSWIDSKFPGIPRRRLLAGKVHSAEASSEFSLEAFIRSRAWSELSHPAA